MIYADYAASTPTRREVVEEMLPYYSEDFGNPSGIHSYATAARNAVEAARESVARSIGAISTNEVVFTSGGTESNNLALCGLARALGSPGDQIITSAVEHAAVSAPIASLKEEGYEVISLPVDRFGLVSARSLRENLSPRTVLVSVMMVNNEVGTVQPIMELGKLLLEHRAVFHTDAAQAVRVGRIDVDELFVDALSLSAHKFYGPKGVGALWVRSGLTPAPLLQGGGQERARRSGTENVPGIVGMAKALELVRSDVEPEARRLKGLSERLAEGLVGRIDGCILTGHPHARHPAIVSFTIDGTEGESLLIQLDRLGVAASTGSACSTTKRHASPVLAAMGISESQARGSLRFSLGAVTTEEDIDELIARTVRAVELVRGGCLSA